MQKLFFRIYLNIFSLSMLGNCASFPEYTIDEKSEKLSAKMKTGANWNNWQETDAITFLFAGNDFIFWDKKRNLVEVAWSSWGDKIKVQFSQKPFAAEVWVDDEVETDSGDRSDYVKKAYELFTNHTFWFNPAYHVFSPGTRRGITGDGDLAVIFSSGGVTPGDKYLFKLDESGKIKSMRMWVSIVPFKGLTASFTDYIKTESNLQVSTLHEIGFFDLKLANVASYTNYPAGEDRFKPLLEKIAQAKS